MACLTPRGCGSGLQLRRQSKASGPPSLVLRAQSGRAEPFNESAAQVKRLINRDRKEFMGNDDDILDKYQTEFDATPSAAPAAVPPPPARKAQVAADPKPKAASTATLPKPAASNPFGSPSAGSNPFGSAAPAQPFRSLNSAMEPVGLRPDMGPDPIIKEKGFNLFENITITQIVIVCSFTLIISLMIGTAYFVYSVGGIRLNGV